MIHEQYYYRDTPAKLRISSNSLPYCGKHRSSQCLACEKLAQVELKIVEARRLLDALFEERDALANSINQEHDHLIQKLPPEVASLILMLLYPHLRSMDVNIEDFESRSMRSDTRGIGNLFFLVTAFNAR